MNLNSDNKARDDFADKMLEEKSANDSIQSEEALPCGVPDLESLTAALTHILNDNERVSDPVTVLDRQPAVHPATFPNEVVTCRLGNGSELTFFCKYSAG